MLPVAAWAAKVGVMTKQVGLDPVTFKQVEVTPLQVKAHLNLRCLRAERAYRDCQRRGLRDAAQAAEARMWFNRLQSLQLESSELRQLAEDNPQKVGSDVQT